LSGSEMDSSNSREYIVILMRGYLSN